jgi:hypothetical protein
MAKCEQYAGGAANIGLISETQRLFALAQQDEKAFAAVE